MRSGGPLEPGLLMNDYSRHKLTSWMTRWANLLVWLSGLSCALSAPIPVIYSTDLMHPHDDPDDHFDLACLYAMPEADLRAVILDNGASQAQRPGFKPVWQL